MDRMIYVAMSAARSAQQAQTVTSHNIANISTTGYKRRRAEFQDLIYQNLRRTGSQSADTGTTHPHEAHWLKLDTSKARQALGWSPRWNLETALAKTVLWHQAWRRGEDMRALCLAQIADYTQAT